MSMSDKMKQAGMKPGSAPAPAPVVSTEQGANANAGGAKPTATKQKTEAFQNHGAQLRAQMSDDQKALEGTKSDAVEFLAALGNPKKSRNRKEGGEYVDSFEVVGYTFKLNEDMEVPHAPLAQDAKNGLNVQKPPQMIAHKAGDVVYLNITETTMFISRPEFAGAFSGNGKHVYISAVYSKSSTTPTPCLKRPSAEGSIKSNIMMVAESVGAGADGKGGTWKCIEGCEQFAPLFTSVGVRRGGSGSAKRAGESAKNTAAAFRALLGI